MKKKTLVYYILRGHDQYNSQVFTLQSRENFDIKTDKICIVNDLNSLSSILDAEHNDVTIHLPQNKTIFVKVDSSAYFLSSVTEKDKYVIACIERTLSGEDLRFQLKASNRRFE